GIQADGLDLRQTPRRTQQEQFLTANAGTARQYSGFLCQGPKREDEHRKVLGSRAAGTERAEGSSAARYTNAIEHSIVRCGRCFTHRATTVPETTASRRTRAAAWDHLPA